MAVAVVKDGQVVLARGFGTSDLDAGTPVTTETAFAIGSSTKAFTATVLGMLVDEGKLGWDDPLSRHVPDLRLKVQAEAPDAQATVRDALSHRTGFPRMSILWIGDTLTLAEIFQHASQAEPTARLGQAFQYNNVVFTAAGEAGARAAGMPWETLVRQRLLTPLGMSRTTVSLPEARQRGGLATGYAWSEDGQAHTRESMRTVEAMAPAGAINSTALDMARWLRFQLAGGMHGGERLISEAALAETRTVQIDAGGAAYGLGWFVDDWKGQAHVHHGGNIDGFAANVGFLPEAGVGYVFLSNLSVTPLQHTIGPLVFEALLGEEARAEGAAGGEDLDAYPGEYMANFGPFEDTPFVVTARGGQLRLEVPGQGVLTLAPPDEQGRRAFSEAPSVAVSFSRDDGGKVTTMYVHQNGFDFELPRKGVAQAIEVDDAQVAHLLGRYELADKGGTVVAVLVDGGRLAVDVPGQTRFQLHLPDDEGRWRLRMRRSFHVTFELDEGGKAKGLTIHQSGKSVAYRRLPDDAANAPVTMDAIHALRQGPAREAALAKLGAGVMEGTVRFAQAGLSGTIAVHFAGMDRYRRELDMGKAGRIVEVVSGDAAWTGGTLDDPEQLAGQRLAQARLEHPLVLAGDWRARFDSIRLVGTETQDGKSRHVVQLRAGTLPAVTVHLDTETGDVLETHTRLVHPQGKLPVTTRFSDYRDVGGVRLPFAMTIETFQNGQMIVELARIRTGQAAKPALFPSAPPAQ